VIRTEHLPNTTQERYLYANPFHEYMELHLLSPVLLHDLVFNETQGQLYLYLKLR
jgi:hypothetical protein